jgi:YbbR domain-containing protein
MSFFDRLIASLTYNSGAKIISVVIAAVLWVVVLGSRSIEVTKDIPLEIITPSHLVAANEVPEKVSFKLAGPKAFLRAILDRPESPIRVNLSGAKAGLVTYRFFSDNISLPIGVKVLSVTPASIMVKLETIKRKEVPVRLELAGHLPEGYQVTQATVKPTHVKIKGAESKIDAISEIPTQAIDLAQLKSTLTMQADLDLARQGLEVEGGIPQVFIEITPVQANFKIKNVQVRVQSKFKVKLDDPAVTVFVRIDPQSIATLDRSQVYAEVDLQDKQKGRYNETVRVHLPSHVGLVRVSPEKVKVTLY